MTIRTRIAPLYALRMVGMAIACVVFGIWGVIDLMKIQRTEQAIARVAEIQKEMDQIEAAKAERTPRGQDLDADQVQRYTDLNAELAVLKPGGVELVQPRRYDKPLQWLFILCLPFAPYFLWNYIKTKRQVYSLDEDGTFHFTGDPELKAGAWPREEIADIDMSRWMAKSIAHAVHTGDGKRLKLDAYVHKDLHLIIGAIASRLYPDKWDEQAKLVKPPADEPIEPGEAGDAGDAGESSVRAESGPAKEAEA